MVNNFLSVTRRVRIRIWITELIIYVYVATLGTASIALYKYSVIQKSIMVPFFIKGTFFYEMSHNEDIS